MAEMIFGGWPMGGWHWTDVDESQVIEAARCAAENGIRVFDSAPVYGFGLGEERMGKALAPLRGRVSIMTKFGLRWNVPGTPFFDTSFEGDSYSVVHDLRPESIMTQCEASLKRLGIEVIDCYQMHFHDGKTDLIETAQVMEELIRKGWIRSWGVCNLNTGDLNRLVAAGEPPVSLQFHYNLLNRKAERSVIPYCQRHDIRFLAYSPLARGMLAGSVHERWNDDDDRRFWRGDRIAKMRARMAELQPLAEELHASPVALLLAWTGAVAGVDGVLVGCRTPIHARDMVTARSLSIPLQVHRRIADLFC